MSHSTHFRKLFGHVEASPRSRMVRFIGKKVVHSAKAAAGEVCHLLWMPPLVAPSQDALTHTFWDAGCHSRDVSQSSTDYNMYLCRSAPCDYLEVKPQRVRKASGNGLCVTSRMLFKQDQIYFRKMVVQSIMQTTVTLEHQNETCVCTHRYKHVCTMSLGLRQGVDLLVIQALVLTWWKRVISLFNQIFRFISTFAMTETLNESSQTLATPVTDSSHVPCTHTLPAITQMLKNLPLLSILQMNKGIEEKNVERSRKTFNHSFDPVVHTQPGSNEASLISLDKANLNRFRVPSFMASFPNLIYSKLAKWIADEEIKEKKLKRKPTDDPKPSAEEARIAKWCCMNGQKMVPWVIGVPWQATFPLVFGIPVQSGFLMPQGLNHNRNRSSQFKKCQKTGLNCNRPVFCGYRTGFNRFWS